MDTNKKELTLDEMEQVDGGVSGYFVATTGTAGIGGGIAGAAVAFGLSGPVGWCVLGGALIGAGTMAIINYVNGDT